VKSGENKFNQAIYHIAPMVSGFFVRFPALKVSRDKKKDPFCGDAGRKGATATCSCH